MIQKRSILDVADNSGARKIAVINPIGVDDIGIRGQELVAEAAHRHRLLPEFHLVVIETEQGYRSTPLNR